MILRLLATPVRELHDQAVRRWNRYVGNRGASWLAHQHIVMVAMSVGLIFWQTPYVGYVTLAIYFLREVIQIARGSRYLDDTFFDWLHAGLGAILGLGMFG